LLREGFAGDFVLFPREWFYPYNYNEKHRAKESFPQAYAVHHWACSWGNTDYRFFKRVNRKLKRMVHMMPVLAFWQKLKVYRFIR
jgi:hypothetical protein